MPVFNVEGFGVADHTYLIDTTGYTNGDSSLTTITMANFPAGFEFGVMTPESPLTAITQSEQWAVSVKLHGDIELDAFRRGLAQLVQELDAALGGTIEERDHGFGDEPPVPRTTLHELHEESQKVIQQTRTFLDR